MKALEPRKLRNRTGQPIFLSRLEVQLCSYRDNQDNHTLSMKMAAQPPPYGTANAPPPQQGYFPPPQQGYAPPPPYAPSPQQAGAPPQQPVINFSHTPFFFFKTSRVEMWSTPVFLGCGGPACAEPHSWPVSQSYLTCGTNKREGFGWNEWVLNVDWNFIQANKFLLH